MDAFGLQEQGDQVRGVNEVEINLFVYVFNLRSHMRLFGKAKFLVIEMLSQLS